MLPSFVENQIHAQEDQNIKERMLSPPTKDGSIRSFIF
jgi:hypothetical protein